MLVLGTERIATGDTGIVAAGASYRIFVVLFYSHVFLSLAKLSRVVPTMLASRLASLGCTGGSATVFFPSLSSRSLTSIDVWKEYRSLDSDEAERDFISTPRVSLPAYLTKGREKSESLYLRPPHALST